MTWTAYLIRPMTGEVGAELSIAASGKWSIDLNDIEEFEVTVSKEQIRGIEPSWWRQWSGGVLITKIGVDGAERPWVAGPIVDPPEEARETVTLTCRGIGAILEQRVVLAKDFLPGGSSASREQAQALAESVVRRSGMSFGTIMQEVVKLSTDPKTGGYLPIRFASPREVKSTLNERTYWGYNLANNLAWKRLTELSNVLKGPDMMFRPEWEDSSRTGVVWAMHHGTVAQPAIAQDWEMSLDTTAPRGPLADVKVTHDGADVVNRVYWTGAGEDQGTLVKVVQDLKRMREYVPLLETVGSTSDSDNPKLILEHARARLRAGASPLTQLTLVVDGDDERTELGHWHVGDLAAVTLAADEWLTLPGGTTRQRIIAASGDFVSSKVKLDFQEDTDWYDDEEELVGDDV